MPNNFPQPTVWLQSGDPNLENRPNGTVDPTLYPGQLGSRFWIVDPVTKLAKGYQLVMLDSNAMNTLPFLGAVAWWASRALYTVTTAIANSGGRGQVAGVFLRSFSAADVTAQRVGCIQIAGPSTVNFIGSPTANPSAAGLFVIPSGTDASADCLAAGTASTYPKLGESTGVLTGNLAPVNLTIDDVNP